MKTIAFPRSRFESMPADLTEPGERTRLGGPGLKAFFRISEAWRLRDSEARALLGGVSNGRFYTLKRQAADGEAPTRPLSQDLLTRISLLIGIYKALHILYDDNLADRWMTLANKNPMFEGRRVLDVAIEGGIPALARIRQLLDARRGYLA